MSAPVSLLLSQINNVEYLQQSIVTISNSLPSDFNITPPELITEGTKTIANPTPSPEFSQNQQSFHTTHQWLWISLVSTATGLMLIWTYKGRVQQWKLQTNLNLWDNTIGEDAVNQPFLTQPLSFPRSISYGILTLITILAFIITWSSLATVEEVVSAPGEIQTKTPIQDLQTPITGMISTIHVQEGDTVEAGQILIKFDDRQIVAELTAIEQQMLSLQAQNQFYQLAQQNLSPEETKAKIVDLKLPPQLIPLIQDRALLVSENQLYQQLLRQQGGDNLPPIDRLRLQVHDTNFRTQKQTIQLAIAQLQEQLQQNRRQQAETYQKLEQETAQLRRTSNNNREVLQALQRQINQEEEVLRQRESLLADGVISSFQYEQQQQKVRALQQEFLRQRNQREQAFLQQMQGAEYQQNRLKQLQDQGKSIQLAIAQSQSQAQNLISQWQTAYLDRIADNSKRIAEIDRYLTQTMLANHQRLAILSQQQNTLTQQLEHHTLYAPISGVIFDLKSVNTGQIINPQKILGKVVPQDGFMVQLKVRTQDVAQLQENQPVRLQLDSQPFARKNLQFRAKVEQIGADRLPPNELSPFEHFPVRLSLDWENLDSQSNLNSHYNSQPEQNSEPKLRSGMTLKGHIQVGENQRVIELVWDWVRKKAQNLEF
ncbi:HlyD family efflux transporter periplasmic adaptor subunit [Spirulina subsalsa FACHB-351]|uniref:HlyD family efflux transporter periplasmic adaptor subunit n=1 Tax=Spirulina subsalsa FACHB-351 TaxID=234711 RepID=A0ABT3L0Z7_9CYAN|nr:HlyD family efflux transporter periplasmic adaptor subunit [Spirulina subsalsa]MCW6035178.1 HlyD family efflux transporter periplasmic adaptor subunit [Spirulina subsalsa FACHB-351]